MAIKNRLDRLTIRGFQSIRALEDFKLNDLNILIGANGAGKSNFVNYFRMLSELVEQRLQVWVNKRGGADRLLTFGIKETHQLFSFLWFGDNGYEFTLEPADDEGFVFVAERLYYENDGLVIGSGHREARLKDEINPRSQYWRANYCYNSISSWKVFHFHDTSDAAGVKQSGSVDDAAYLRSDASNLAAYLYRLQENNPDTYSQIRKTVQLAIPFFYDFILEPRTIKGGDQQIRLLWRQRDSDYSMWPTQLSDGSIRFIALATALLQPDPPSTIIIDEPELGLHPYAITLLGSLMRSASTRMQIIVSTQSVPLLNEFDIEDLIIAELEDGASVFKRLNGNDFEMWLEEYTVGELWEKNILGGRSPGYFSFIR
ncbi:MAG: AAA family ATPase [Chloroflexi bacterium]|nr:AAA family ATPase [Chloroflexota bacterium]